MLGVVAERKHQPAQKSGRGVVDMAFQFLSATQDRFSCNLLSGQLSAQQQSGNHGCRAAAQPHTNRDFGVDGEMSGRFLAAKQTGCGAK